MIRGPVASIRSGPAGSGPRSMQAGAEAEAPLPAGMRLGHHRGPGRRGTASGHSSPVGPEFFVRPSAFQSPDRRSDNTVTGWYWFSRPAWRRIRTFDTQIRRLMLYPTELSVVGSNSRIRTCDLRILNPTLFQTELHPRPIRPPKRRRTQGRQCRLRGRRRKLQPLCSLRLS